MRQVAYYRGNDTKGQVFRRYQRTGANAPLIVTAGLQLNQRFTMIPVYIYYSMFVSKRVGDMAWAAGDSKRVVSYLEAPRAAPLLR